MKKLLWIFAVLVIISCSTQNKLSRQYVGKEVTILKKEFGNPIQTEIKDSIKILQFEKIENTRAAVIDEGRPTRDPIISPSTSRVIRYYFTVKDGIITDVSYIEAYRD